MDRDRHSITHYPPSNIPKVISNTVCSSAENGFTLYWCSFERQTEWDWGKKMDNSRNMLFDFQWATPQWPEGITWEYKMWDIVCYMKLMEQYLENAKNNCLVDLDTSLQFIYRWYLFWCFASNWVFKCGLSVQIILGPHHLSAIKWLFHLMLSSQFNNKIIFR